MKYLLLVSTTALLMACGSGGGDGETTSASNSAPPAPAPVSAPAPAPAPTPPPVSTAPPSDMEDVVVTKAFDFIGKDDLTIQMSNNMSAARVYLNVCSDYSTVSGKVKVDYKTCQLRTTLPSGSTEYKISLSGDTEQLIAQVWALEEGAVPQSFYWSASNNASSWDITVN